MHHRPWVHSLILCAIICARCLQFCKPSINPYTDLVPNKLVLNMWFTVGLVQRSRDEKSNKKFGKPENKQPVRLTDLY